MRAEPTWPKGLLKSPPPLSTVTLAIKFEHEFWSGQTTSKPQHPETSILAEWWKEARVIHSQDTSQSMWLCVNQDKKVPFSRQTQPWASTHHGKNAGWFQSPLSPRGRSALVQCTSYTTEHSVWVSHFSISRFDDPTEFPDFNLLGFWGSKFTFAICPLPFLAALDYTPPHRSSCWLWKADLDLNTWLVFLGTPISQQIRGYRYQSRKLIIRL